MFTSNGQLIKLKVISRDSSPGLGISSSGGSTPSDKEAGRGHPDPETKGGGGVVSTKKIFWPFGPQFGLKTRPPGPLSWTRH